MQVLVLLSAPKQKERFSLSFCFGASLGTSTRRLADVGHIPLAESCRGVPVYGKRQRPVVRICFSKGSRIVARGKTRRKEQCDQTADETAVCHPVRDSEHCKDGMGKIIRKECARRKVKASGIGPCCPHLF